MIESFWATLEHINFMLLLYLLDMLFLNSLQKISIKKQYFTINLQGLIYSIKFFGAKYRFESLNAFKSIASSCPISLGLVKPLD